MIEYIFKSAVSLALLYSLFFVCLSRETFHRFNRVCLLAIMLFSLVLPLVHFTVSEPTVINEAVMKPTAYLVSKPVIVDTAPTSPSLTDMLATTFIHSVSKPVIIDTAPTSPSLTWGALLTYIYLAGVVVMFLFTSVQVLLMVRQIRGGLRHTDDRGNTVILHPGIQSPFSLFRWIVMSVDDYERHRHCILTHEQEHIRLGHTYDLLLLEAMRIFQWFNPFVWFLGHDLKAIHEYEADEAVIKQGIDAKQYQQLLVLKAVGNRLQPFANNLRRGSLKQRIVMMYQKKSNRWMMLKALFVIPTMGFALYAFATPEAVPDVQAVLNKDVKIIPEKDNASVVGFKDVDPASVHYVLDGKEVSKDEFCKCATLKVEGRTVSAGSVNVTDILQAITPDIAKEILGIDAHVLALYTKNYDPFDRLLESENNVSVKFQDGFDEMPKLRNFTADDVIIIDGKLATKQEFEKLKPKDIDHVNVFKDEEAKNNLFKEALSNQKVKGCVLEVVTKGDVKQESQSPKKVQENSLQTPEDTIVFLNNTRISIQAYHAIPKSEIHFEYSASEDDAIQQYGAKHVIFAETNIQPGESIKWHIFDTSESPSVELAGATAKEVTPDGKVVGQTISDMNGTFHLRINNPKNKIIISKEGYETKSLYPIVRDAYCELKKL